MIHGRVAPGFQSVADAFERGRSGDPGAAQLCVYHEGKVVVDLWSGSDPNTDVAIDGDTLFVLWSTTKGMVAIIAAMLLEQPTPPDCPSCPPGPGSRAVTFPIGSCASSRGRRPSRSGCRGPHPGTTRSHSAT